MIQKSTLLALALPVLLALLLPPSTQAATLHKVLLKDPSALCLDGSPGAYYIVRGTAPLKIIVFFEGGGWCGGETLASTTEGCYHRSKEDLGSSKNYTETITFGSGFLSDDPKNSFHEYTKVFMKYCDGSGHQGSRSAALPYKDAKLYFRGQNITEATFAELERTEGFFSKATDIIVSGSSAGGLATFTWVNYVRSKAKAKNVYAVPDSGIFLDSMNTQTKAHSYRERFVSLFKLTNTEAQVPVPQCVKANPNEQYKCMFAEELIKYIKVPIFAVQSLYDTWSIENILGITCINGVSLASCNTAQRAEIEQYHKNTTRVLQTLGSTGSGHNGYWAPSCAHHTFIKSPLFYSPDYRVPQGSVNTIDATLISWVKEEKVNHHHVDTVEWPGNKPCSGVKGLREDPLARVE